MREHRRCACRPGPFEVPDAPPPRATRAFRALPYTAAVLGFPGTARPLVAEHGIALSPSERAEATGYVLSIDKARPFVVPGADLTRRLAADPAFHAATADVAGQGLTVQAARLERVPQAAAALHAARFTTHDYAVGSRAFRDALMVAGMQARGSAIPPEMDAMFPASPAQVAFVTAHRAELDVIAPEHRARAGRP